MSHEDTLVTAASLIAGFGSAVIVVRLERELDIEDKNADRPKSQKEHHWIPPSDWLVVASGICALRLVVAPLVAIKSPSEATLQLASAVCSAAATMLAGYIPSILAHYRFIYGLSKDRKKPHLLGGRVPVLNIHGGMGSLYNSLLVKVMSARAARARKSDERKCEHA